MSFKTKSKHPIPIKNIFYMLTYAWDLYQERSLDEFSEEDSPDIYNLLAKVFLSSVKHLLKKGLEKSYDPALECSSTLKGKLDFNLSIKTQSFLNAKAWCNFDELSCNTLANKILKATLKQLLKLNLDETLKANSLELYLRLNQIEDYIIQKNDFSSIRLNKNNFHYKLAVNIAKLIHENSLASEDAQRQLFKDFEDEKFMWKLFESFIRNFYDNEQKKYNVRREHIDWQLKAAEDSGLSLLPKMETDISLESATEKIIIETKFYKEALVFKENTFNQALRNKKFHSKHLYQLFSYMKNTEAKGEDKALTGILLYPTVNYSLNESYFIGDTKLKIYTINLNQAWEGIHRDLLELI